MDNNNLNRLYEQTIDILIYDFNNKYQSLKINGIDKEKINKYMNNYQEIRNKNFTDDLSRIRSLINK